MFFCISIAVETGDLGSLKFLVTNGALVTEVDESTNQLRLLYFLINY